MLLGKQGSRHQQCHLPPALDCKKGRAHGDLRLAKAHITAHQPVHRCGRLHVGDHLVDGGLLIRCFLKREGGRKGAIVVVRGGMGDTLAGSPSGVNIQ